jgi:hypothetical protein
MQNKAERQFKIMRLLIILTFVGIVAILGLAIGALATVSSVYTNVRSQVTVSNVQSWVQDVFPEEYIQEIIHDAILAFLQSGFMKSYQTQQNCLSNDIVKSKCDMLNWCARTANTTACLSYFYELKNWCKAYV